MLSNHCLQSMFSSFMWKTWTLFWKIFSERPHHTVFNFIASQGPHVLRFTKGRRKSWRTRLRLQHRDFRKRVAALKTRARGNIHRTLETPKRCCSSNVSQGLKFCVRIVWKDGVTLLSPTTAGCRYRRPGCCWLWPPRRYEESATPRPLRPSAPVRGGVERAFAGLRLREVTLPLWTLFITTVRFWTSSE